MTGICVVSKKNVRRIRVGRNGQNGRDTFAKLLNARVCVCMCVYFVMSIMSVLSKPINTGVFLGHNGFFEFRPLCPVLSKPYSTGLPPVKVSSEKPKISSIRARSSGNGGIT